MNIRLEFNYPEDEDNLKKFVQAVGGREWVGLTDEDKHYLNEALNLQGRFPIIDAIEAKLRKKNA